MKRPTYIANCYFCWWFCQRKHAAAFHRLLALSKVTQYFPININQPIEKEINTGVAVDGTPIPLFGSQYCCPILKGNEAKWRDFFCSEAPHQPGGRFWLRRLASLGCRYILYRCAQPYSYVILCLISVSNIGESKFIVGCTK